MIIHYIYAAHMYLYLHKKQGKFTIIPENV